MIYLLDEKYWILCDMLVVWTLLRTLLRDIYPFVGSTANEEIPRKFLRESHVFPIIVTSLDSTDNKHGVQRQVHRCRRRRNFIYYIEYFRKAAGILLLGVWCKNIQYNIPIITLVGVWPDSLSPLEKLGHPRVTLLFSGRPAIGSHGKILVNCLLKRDHSSY
jgi:hypothetical protein